MTEVKETEIYARSHNQTFSGYYNIYKIVNTHFHIILVDKLIQALNYFLLLESSSKR